MADDIPQVKITVGPLTPDDSSGKFVNDNTPGNAVWTDYLIMNRYEGDDHTYMMGITAAESQQTNADTVAFVKLAGKTTLWICDWTASRWVEKPKIPSKQPQDSRWVFLDEHIEPAQCVLGPDGVTPHWRISGTYFYGSRRPNADTIVDSVFPRPPWMEDDFDRTLDKAVEEGNLKESGSQTPQGGPQPAPPEFPEFGPVKIPGT